jgi:hypothetical protein
VWLDSRREELVIDIPDAQAAAAAARGVVAEEGRADNDEDLDGLGLRSGS